MELGTSAMTVIIFYILAIIQSASTFILMTTSSTQEPSHAFSLPNEEQNPTPGAFEADMMLTPWQQDVIRDDVMDEGMIDRFLKRKLVLPLSYWWPSAIVPYQISDDLDAVVVARIHDAMTHWETKTCVRFEPTSPALVADVRHWDYVRFSPSPNSGCASNVGRIRAGQQMLNVSQYCGIGSIIHELGHTLGFVHEQSRPDRDLHVHINYANIHPGDQKQFQKYSNSDVTTSDLPYDVGSIMHYSPLAFSKLVPTLKTITSFDPLVQRWMGQRSEISFLDAKEVNIAYMCNRHCQSQPQCTNGGYVGQSCTCVCPEGLTGPRCEDAIVTPGCGGVHTSMTGTITSPNYPRAYNMDENCSWYIKAPKNHTIELEFESFDVEFSRSSYQVCQNDYLEVKVHGPQTYGQKYCGQMDTSRGSNILASAETDLVLRFVTDDYDDDNRGFSLHYRIIPV